MKISDILGFLGEEGIPFVFTGNGTDTVEGFSSLKNYKPGSFTWVKKQGNIPEGFDLAPIALAFVSEEVNAGTARNVIRTPESKRAFFSMIEHFYTCEEERPTAGQFTYVSPKVKLGKDVRIGQDAFVGLGVVVVKDVPPGEIVVGNPAKPFHKKNVQNERHTPH